MAGADRGVVRRREPVGPGGLHLVAPRDDLAAELAELRPHLARASLVDTAAALERLLPAPHDTRIRFHHASDLGFHPGEVVAVDLTDDIATITTSLLGLCGVESPLPLYLLDDADRDDDPAAAMRGLLDVVHHRLFSLLLRALHDRDLPESLHRVLHDRPEPLHCALHDRDRPESLHHDRDLPESPHSPLGDPDWPESWHRPLHDPDRPESLHRPHRPASLPRERDRAESLHHDDRWLARLLALLGLRERPALPRPVLVEILPAFAGVRSPAMLAAALRLALRDSLGDAGVRVDPWTGGWLPIDPDQHTRLGTATAVLGDTAVLGAEIFHPAGAATVVIGPLAAADTREFLPGGPAHARIAAVCRSFTPVRLELALELRTRPPALLDERRLGEDFWLGDDPDAAPRHVVPLD